MPTLNISLTSELASLINEKLASGMYHTASEVVRDGLRLLKEKDENRLLQLAELKGQVKTGTDQLDSGESTRYNTGKELAQEIKEAGRVNADSGI